MSFLSILIILCLAVVIFYLGSKYKEQQEQIAEIGAYSSEVERLQEEKKQLELQKNDLQVKKDTLEKEFQKTAQEKEKYVHSIFELKEDNARQETQQQMLFTQISREEQRLESARAMADAEYQARKMDLDAQYEKDSAKIEEKINNLKAELDSWKETRRVAIEAAQREKNIQENKDFYCIQLPIEQQGDINILRNIAAKISKPRAIYMVIWTAYYSPIAKKKIPKILGKETTCGIYKITNQETGECYIGQAIDMKRRWTDHMKAMLGIDAPAGNKLYAAAKEYGLDVFSFELLEECTQKELNEKEKYYISLYSSDTLGYNGNKGVG